MKFIKTRLQDLITIIIVKLAQWVSKLELARRDEIFNEILVNTFDLPYGSKVMRFPAVTIKDDLYTGDNKPVPAINLCFAISLQKSKINSSQLLKRHVSIIQTNVYRGGYSHVGINVKVDARCECCNTKLNHLDPFPYICPNCSRDLKVKFI